MDLSDVIQKAIDQLGKIIPESDTTEDLLLASRSISTLAVDDATDIPYWEDSLLKIHRYIVGISTGNNIDDLLAVVKILYDVLDEHIPEIKVAQECNHACIALRSISNSIITWIAVNEPPDSDDLVKILRERNDITVAKLILLMESLVPNLSIIEDALIYSKSIGELLTVKMDTTLYGKLIDLYHQTKELLEEVHKELIEKIVDINSRIDKIISAGEDITTELRKDIQINKSDIENLDKSLSSTIEALEQHSSDKTNPHDVTKSQVELGSVNNWSATSDVDDSSSVLYATAKGVHQSHTKAVEGFDLATTAMDEIRETNETIFNHKSDTDNPHHVVPEQIGLGNVPNYPSSDEVELDSSEHLSSSKATYISYAKAVQALSVANDGVAAGEVNAAAIKEHSEREDNPHNLKLEDIGGSPDGHNHDEDYAALVHSHPYVPDTRTVNSRQLNVDIEISKADVGLGNVPNYQASDAVDLNSPAFATSVAVKTTHDLTLLKYDKSGGTVSGDAIFNKDLVVNGNLLVAGEVRCLNEVIAHATDAKLGDGSDSKVTIDNNFIGEISLYVPVERRDKWLKLDGSNITRKHRAYKVLSDCDSPYITIGKRVITMSSDLIKDNPVYSEMYIYHGKQD